MVPESEGLRYSVPLRDADRPLGIPRADGSLPPQVIAANAMADLAAHAMRACHSHGGFFIAEAPVSRGQGSPFAIPGREKHTAPLDHPSLRTLTADAHAFTMYLDQCRTRPDPTLCPQKTTALLASPGAEIVRQLFGPLVCNHPRGTHPSMVGYNAEGGYSPPNGRTTLQK